MQTTFAGGNGALQNIFIGYYDAWGVCTVVNDETEEGIAEVNPFRYRSYYYDSETGMYYLLSRYYDPVVGRFINADDVSILGTSETVLGYNLFAYCGNDSINNLEICGFYSLSLEDFKSDWAGREILWQYLYGCTTVKNYNSPKWAKYMKNCRMCSCITCYYDSSQTLEEYINEYVKSLRKKLLPKSKKGQRKIHRRILAAVQNGEGIIGYNYLHGVNPNVGGLSLYIIAKWRGDQLLVFIQCEWNDIIDPGKYISDEYKSKKIAKKIPFAKPTDYVIHIYWNQILFL